MNLPAAIVSDCGYSLDMNWMRVSLIVLLTLTTFHASGDASDHSSVEAPWLGEVGVSVGSERREEASGAATSERSFRVDVATGLESNIGNENRISYGAVVKSERGFRSSADVSSFGAGAFLGYRQRAISLRLDYMIFNELKSTDASTETSFKDGSGWSLEVRWLPQWIDLGNENQWALGPSLSFSQTTYRKSRVGTLPESNTERRIESLSPGIRAIFIF